MGKQKFLQYKTLVFFYENKCFPCVKLLFYTMKNHKYLYIKILHIYIVKLIFYLYKERKKNGLIIYVECRKFL